MFIFKDVSDVNACNDYVKNERGRTRRKNEAMKHEGTEKA